MNNNNDNQNFNNEENNSINESNQNENQNKNNINENEPIYYINENKNQYNINENHNNEDNNPNQERPMLDHMGNPINQEQNKKNVTYIILIFVAIAFLSLGYNSTSVTSDIPTSYYEDY